MPWLLRHYQYQLHTSEINLTTDAVRSFVTLMRANRLLPLVATAGSLALSNPAFGERTRETPKKPVSTEYQGVTVKDPYQWLDSDEYPQVQAWSGAGHQRTRQYLNKL